MKRERVLSIVLFHDSSIRVFMYIESFFLSTAVVTCAPIKISYCTVLYAHADRGGTRDVREMTVLMTHFPDVTRVTDELVSKTVCEQSQSISSRHHEISMPVSPSYLNSQFYSETNF